ncbi:hypothetical protein HY484_02515 [Candidatus Woesearchaeota archaeon]|nr:hypothetical protein [Candidatus Woesearchaeota archaeon]
MRLQEIIGISTITIASLVSGCNGPAVKLQSELSSEGHRKGEQTEQKQAAQEYKTLKGKIVGKLYSTVFENSNNKAYSFALQTENKTQQAFIIEVKDKLENERIIRLLEVGNYIEVDVDKNKFFKGFTQVVQSEKIRQGTAPEISHNPVLETVVERTLKTDKQEEQLPQNTLVEPVEGTVIGRTYYQFKENEQTYLFAIQTKYGIKTVETEIRDKIDEETLAVLVQPGKTVIIPVLTDKLEEKLYKVPVGRIGYLIKIAGDKKQNKR